MRGFEETTAVPASVPTEQTAGSVIPADLQQWRTSGDYLPAFMRDFHDQKDLFKALQDVVDRANAKHGGHRSLQAPWSEYHIYTVDIFLWIMAGHGYTLQRSRRRFAFPSIHDFVGEATRKAREISASILADAFAKRSVSPAGYEAEGEVSSNQKGAA